VTKELLHDRITQEQNGTLACDCPRHASQSRKSLRVNTEKQSWYCFGCDAGGDVLQLVEFVQSGTVTKGRTGVMPDSHRQARDWLAERAGMAPLSTFELSDDERAKIERLHACNQRALACLTAMIERWHVILCRRDDILQWIDGQYGFSGTIINEIKLGYADNGIQTVDEQTEPGIIQYLRDLEFTDDEMFATGAFTVDSSNRLQCIINNRLIFPYWSRGQARYLAARRTPWTENKPFEQAKYKKLRVRDEHEWKHVSEAIDNSLLMNEDVLLSDTDYVIIAEGAPDCVAGMDHGLPTVSPVGARIKKNDWDRLITKFAKIKTVYIAGDNEPSKVGLQGALATARVLSEHGIDARLVLLSPGEAQLDARAQLEARFDVTETLDADEVALKKRALSGEERDVFLSLSEQAKIDLCEWFKNPANDCEIFSQLMQDAVTPIELAIRRLPTGPDPDMAVLEKRLEPVLQELIDRSPLEQKSCARKIREHVGKGITVSDIEQQIRAYRKGAKKKGRTGTRHSGNAVRDHKCQITSPPGTCKHEIERARYELEFENLPAEDVTKACAEAVFEWFEGNGAKYFRTSSDDLFMLWAGKNYRMTASAGRSELYASMVFKHTGYTPASAQGRVFFATLMHIAVDRSDVRDSISWLQTDVRQYVVYFNLNCDDQIAKITPDGPELIPNGTNADGVFLRSSGKLLPIHYVPDDGKRTFGMLFKEYILRHLTCSRSHGSLLFLWLSCFLLMDFAGTRPATRFEGGAGSGKTTAAKLMSMLIYGQQVQKISTTAADYVDAEQSPLLLWDNLELKNLDDDKIQLILSSVTGVVREKRGERSPTDVVRLQPKCLINSSGIDPIAGDLSEILSRTLVLQFTREKAEDEAFLETDVLRQIKDNRDFMLSRLIDQTGHVLKLISEGAHGRVMRLLSAELGSHPHKRCNDYFALMYLMMIADRSPANIEHNLTQLDRTFKCTIDGLSVCVRNVAQESNHVSTALHTLFSIYQNASESPLASVSADVQNRYLLKLHNEGTEIKAFARDLWLALTNVAKDKNLTWPYKSPQQFVQRMLNDLDTIRESGFEITKQRVRDKHQWIIKKVEDPNEPQTDIDAPWVF
jgi:hypothetical protein